MSSTETIIEQAAHWHIASQRVDMDWDAFTAWLEADPAHARAYDEVALTDALLDEVHVPAVLPMPANDEPVRLAQGRFGWKRWAGAAVAASLLAVIGVPLLRSDPGATYRTQEQAMTVTLEDGSRVELSPASELAVAADGEHMTLTGGAYFNIRHDPARQLTISAGPLAISDIGTTFDVQVTADHVRVAVSDGRVSVGSPRLATSVELVAGRQLLFDGASGRSTAMPVDSQDVGTWRTGQLTYSATPLALVSADLNRYAGVQLDVPGNLADRMFSGTLAIEDGNSAMRDLAQIMGLELERAGTGYRLRQPTG